MIAYPNVQKKCQEELDRVIGRTRMSTLKDKESLPYIRATVRELFRWRAVAPFSESSENIWTFLSTDCDTGIPHCTNEVVLSYPLVDLRFAHGTILKTRVAGTKGISFPKGLCV